MSNLNFSLYLIHLYFPTAYQGWLAPNWKSSSSCNQIHRTTFIFTHPLPSLLLLKTLPSSYPKSIPLTLSYLGSYSLYSFCPTCPPELLIGSTVTSTDLNVLNPFRSVISPEDVQHWNLLVTHFSSGVLHQTLLVYFLALWQFLFRLLCWLLHLYPISNVGQPFRFIPDFFSPLSLSLDDLIYSDDLQFVYAYNF